MTALLLGAALVGLARPGLSLTAMEQVVTANNDFAMDLYAKIRNDPSQAGNNIFISPFCVSAALAVVYAGAKGNTRSQMGNVLNLDGVSDVDGGFRQLFDALNDPAHAYTLNVANALFLRKAYPFQQAYLDLVSQSYHSLLKSMDFAGTPEISRTYINGWVSNKTNKKILNLLGLGSIDASTVMVVVNAIYFKGLWKCPFDTFDTYADTFNMSSSNSVDIDMMNKYVTPYFYAELPHLDSQILELPYVGEEVSMYILLPNNVDGLASLEGELSVTRLNDAISSMRETVLDITLPKFKLTQKLDLSTFLKSMGMVDVFDEALADLSGIDGSDSLTISGVVHKAYVDVNEEGTEAAGATGIMVGASGLLIPVYFNANHPFLFFIREKVSGSILFSGRFVAPPVGGDAASSVTDGGTPDVQPDTVLPNLGTDPYWCQPLSQWLCQLYMWLGCKPAKRATSPDA